MGAPILLINQNFFFSSKFIFHCEQTYIYIYTIRRQLQYPWEALQSFAYIRGGIWMSQYITATI